MSELLWMIGRENCDWSSWPSRPRTTLIRLGPSLISLGDIPAFGPAPAAPCPPDWPLNRHQLPRPSEWSTLDDRPWLTARPTLEPATAWPEWPSNPPLEMVETVEPESRLPWPSWKLRRRGARRSRLVGSKRAWGEPGRAIAPDLVARTAK